MQCLRKLNKSHLFRQALLTLSGCMFEICHAAPLPECPPTLAISQAAQAAPDGWESVPYSGAQRLARITFKLSADPGELRHDEERTKSGKKVLTWHVEGLTGLEQICVYSGTLARLSRPVAGTVSRCEVHEEKLASGGVKMTGECR